MGDAKMSMDRFLAERTEMAKLRAENERLKRDEEYWRNAAKLESESCELRDAEIGRLRAALSKIVAESEDQYGDADINRIARAALAGEGGRDG